MTESNAADLAASMPPPGVAAPAAQASYPGRVLGIVGFALSLLAVLNIVGLVLSIVALVQGRRAGALNGFALAGVIVGGIGVLITVLIAATAIPSILDAVLTCQRLGDGVHVIGNATYTCTPTSAYVSHRFA
jgi:hypothetical protein